MIRRPLLVLLLLTLAAWLTPLAAEEDPDEAPETKATEEAPAPAEEDDGEDDEEADDEEDEGDPTREEVPLPALGGWQASLVLDNDGVGVWAVKSFQVFPDLACPEIVALDDRGICWVLTGYSGKWYRFETVHDGRWLGGLAQADVDPRIEGPEIYTGSQRGNVYQVVAYPHATFDHRLIAHIEGCEIHTVVAGDLDPRTPGRELLVFTRPGGLYRLTPTGKDGRFELTKLQAVRGRVRDAVLLPGKTAEIATVSRAGRLAVLRITGQGPQWKTVYEAPMGKGRIALGPTAPGAPLVLYTTHDDGRIVRHEGSTSGSWKSKVIYDGPQGPRGIVAGRFDDDPNTETVAVFGYSEKVELLTSRAGRWTSELIFEDGDKGHWLAKAEVDGRNSTEELLACGFGGRVVLLARPPGYGREGLAAER